MYKYFTLLIAPLETAYSTTERNKDNFDSQTGKAGYLDNTIAAQQQQIDIFTKILVGGDLEVSDIFKCASVYYFFKKSDGDNTTEEEEEELLVPKQPPPSQFSHKKI